MAKVLPNAAPEGDPLAWSSDGVERPESYGKFYSPRSTEDLRFRFMRRRVVSARRWRGYVDQKLRRIDQTQARWETLLCISAHDRPTQSELARLVSVEDPTVARMLNALEKDGDVRRIVASADRRQRLVELTPQGETALVAMQLIIDLLRDSVLQDLTPDELEAGLRILDKVLARLETA
jgi:DNA-binding MarR family transcriptional regulator